MHNSVMTTQGADRAAWSMAKIGRARQHGLELQSRIAGWTATANPGAVASIADDRLGWKVRLSEFDGPPLGEWALILGDGIHSLRSALDVLVWAHADTALLTGQQAKQIAFPVWTEQAPWDEHAARVLRTVPAETVQRIRECQPFQRPAADRPADALRILSDLDNTDKHRLALTTSVEPRGADWSHGIEFADEEAASRNAPPDVTIHDHALVSSALLLSGTTVDPIVRMSGSFSLTMQVGLDAGNGFVGAIELIESMAVCTATVVAHVVG